MGVAGIDLGLLDNENIRGEENWFKLAEPGRFQLSDELSSNEVCKCK